MFIDVKLRPDFSYENSSYNRNDARETFDSCLSEVNDGLLNVQVQPEDAALLLNGSPLGNAEGLADAGIILPEGTHTIRLEAAGHLRHEETIQVSCEEPMHLDIEMVRES